MSVTAVVGAQWGDEGKGRVVDYLAEDADLVIRYGGGNNAGHTVVNDHGLSPARETIIHCQAGVRTTMGVFALSLLGWDGVRAHEASLAEWANRDDTPLVTGEDVAG